MRRQKNINDRQCTIVWHVDDNKISHVDADMVEDVISKIESKFGKVVVTRGDTHNFLGIRATFPGDRTVHIDTIQHVKEAIEDFGKPMDRGAATPALRNLFDMEGKTEGLTPRQQQKFRSIVPKLLWVTKRGRPDIELPVAFLCTRVDKCKSSDWKKTTKIATFSVCNDKRCENSFNRKYGNNVIIIHLR